MKIGSLFQITGTLYDHMTDAVLGKQMSIKTGSFSNYTVRLQDLCCLRNAEIHIDDTHYQQLDNAADKVQGTMQDMHVTSTGSARGDRR